MAAGMSTTPMKKQQATTRKSEKEISSEAKEKLEENKKIIYGKNRTTKPLKQPKQFDWLGYGLLVILIIITIVTYPDFDSLKRKVNAQHVFYYGWITAIATGGGVLPFYFFSEPDKFWMGVSNGKFDCAYMCDSTRTMEQKITHAMMQL
jgi:hypothetical protein